jgi:oligosaccharide repeat unit polymerase
MKRGMTGVTMPTLAAKRNAMLHPLTIATIMWGALLGLYALHFSNLLLFRILDLVPIALAIWTPFAIVALGYALWRPRILRHRYKLKALGATQLAVIEKRLKLLFRFWVVTEIFETFISGGLPITWLFTNVGKTYKDYGIPSLHGMANSLIMALALARVGLYLFSGEKRHLRVPLFSIVWWMVVIARGPLISSLLECSVLWLCIRPTNWKTIARIAVYSMLVVLSFGWVGDLRTGADTFRELARPSANYPQWLPSGILWAYIYATTPFNNLVYQESYREPLDNPLFPHTFAPVLPTVVRNYLVGEDAGDQSAVVDAVVSNVSTAYAGPLEDFGLPAVFLFSTVVAIFCQWFWYKPDFRSVLIFGVLAQCLVFSVFFNLFLSLPFITQVGWIALIFRRTGRSASGKTRRNTAVERPSPYPLSGAVTPAG